MIVFLLKKEKNECRGRNFYFSGTDWKIFFFQMAVRCLSRIGRLLKKGGPCFPIISVVY